MFPPPAAPSIMPLLLSTMQHPMQPSISISFGRVSFAVAMRVSFVGSQVVDRSGSTPDDRLLELPRHARRYDDRKAAAADATDRGRQRVVIFDDDRVDDAAAGAPPDRDARVYGLQQTVDHRVGKTGRRAERRGRPLAERAQGRHAEPVAVDLADDIDLVVVADREARAAGADRIDRGEP